MALRLMPPLQKEGVRPPFLLGRSMASGKKNYFRHSMNAFEDDKIQMAIDLLGYEGYAYYFILLEVLARQCQESCNNPITIHQQTLRIVWRKQSKSCKKVVEKLQESGLFVATFKGNFIEFDIPKLAKYLGKYTNKNTPNTPNKRKEKKRKEKEIKEKKIKVKNLPLTELFSDPEIIDWLNSGTEKLQSELINNYDEGYLRKAVESAYYWQLENKSRKAGAFIKSWVERDKNAVTKIQSQDAIDFMEKIYNERA